LPILFASPAFAHVGDHAHFDLMGMLAHLFEADHLVFAGITVIATVLAFRAGRRAEAKVRIRQEQDTSGSRTHERR
jgi:hypothetical protein